MAWRAVTRLRRLRPGWPWLGWLRLVAEVSTRSLSVRLLESAVAIRERRVSADPRHRVTAHTRFHERSTVSWSTVEMGIAEAGSGA